MNRFSRPSAMSLIGVGLVATIAVLAIVIPLALVRGDGCEVAFSTDRTQKILLRAILCSESSLVFSEAQSARQGSSSACLRPTFLSFIHPASLVVCSLLSAEYGHSATQISPPPFLVYIWNGQKQQVN